MQRRFYTLDVFTSQRYTGNGLAVVYDGDGLVDAAMQAMAREFNQSETVFVFAPDDARQRARLRIFTPGRELPFAGHPTIGAAVLLGCIDGGTGARDMVFGEVIGPVTCRVQPKGDRGDASFVVPQAPQRVGGDKDAAKLAAALGLAASDIGFNCFVPQDWTAGNPMTFVPLRDRDAVARARPDSGKWSEAVQPGDPVGMFVFCNEPINPHHTFHARMFAPGLGVAEDPATGSAAAALAGLLAASGTLPDGKHHITIEQGYEMGRPSLLTLKMSLDRGQLGRVEVAGEAVIVSQGMIEA